MVPGADRRLAEARRAGFTRALVPASTPRDSAPADMHIDAVRTLAEALQTMCGPPVGATGADTMPPWSTVARAASR
jgi:hypothetical protein